MICPKCGENVEAWQSYYGIACTQCLYPLFSEFSAKCKHKQKGNDDDICDYDGPADTETDASGNEIELYPPCEDYCSCPRQEEFFEWVKSKFSE